MMRIPPFRGGGGATNERPAANKASSSADASSAKCNSASSSNAQRCSVEDVYKARCSDLEREIVQLKLELAEAKTANAYIVQENRTLNKELGGQQKKVGELLVQNSKLGMDSLRVRRDLHMSVKREDSWKERVNELHDENVQLRHCAENRSSNPLLGNLLRAKTSTGSLVPALSGLFGVDSVGDVQRRHGPSGTGSSTSTRLSRANSYGLQRTASAPVNVARPGGGAASSTCHPSRPRRTGSVHPSSSSGALGMGNHSMAASGTRGNSTWAQSNIAGRPLHVSSAAVAGGKDGPGANMFLSILEHDLNP